MTRYQIALSSCDLSLDCDAVRNPPRPLALRHQDYEEKFDFTTLFFDCFWNVHHDGVVMIGPPTLNLMEELNLEIRAFPSGTPCKTRSLGSVSLSRTIAEVPVGTTALIIQAGETQFYAVPQPNLSSLFHDRRVITAINKNNDIQWICDWIQFYRTTHDCTGVLIYDNQSTLYSVAELYNGLARAASELPIVIVPWNFKYGVADYRGPVSYLMADSLYCQKGMLEHARFRFLECAASVLNVDIDELVLTEKEASIFTLAEASETGLLSIKGKWVENFTNHPLSPPPRHKDFFYVEKGLHSGCEPKWAVVPKRVPHAAQWFVHFIYGMPASEPEEAVELRHFKAINTNWNLDKSRSGLLRTSSPPADREKLCRDALLESALEIAFSSDGSVVPHAPVPQPSVAYRLRSHAAHHAATERWVDAIDKAKAAAELMPEHPGFSLYLAHLHKKAGNFEPSDHESHAHAIREKDPWYHFQLGRWHQDDGAIEVARECYEKALALAPSFSLAYSKLAEIERFLGRPANVLPLVRAWVQARPDDALGYFLLAKEYERRKRRCDALRSCEAALKLNSIEPSFKAFRAKLLFLVGRTREAEEVLREAIDSDFFSVRMQAFENAWRVPNEQMQLERYLRNPPDLVAEFAELMLKKGDLDSAEAAARKALRRAAVPGNYRLISEILIQQGKQNEAQQLLEKGIAIATRHGARPTSNSGAVIRHHFSHASRADQLAQLLRLADRRQEPVDVLQTALLALPNSCLLHRKLADLLAENSDLERAVETLRAGIRFKPEEAILHEKLSILLADRDLSAATEAARAAVGIEPDNPVFSKRLAKFLTQAGKDQEAKQILLNALEIEPHDSELYFTLSKLLQRQQRLNPAVEAARHAIRLTPRSANYRDNLARLLLQQGQIQDAEAILRQALDDGLENGAIHYRLSKLLQKRGCLEEALQAASLAVCLEPEKALLRQHCAVLLKEARQNGGEVLQGGVEIKSTKTRSWLFRRAFIPSARKISQILARGAHGLRRSLDRIV